MKKIFTKYIAFIVLAASVALLIPAISNRVKSENKNKNVVISVLYNDIKNKVSQNNLEKFLEKLKKNDLNTISVMEDDINSFIARGDVTSIKYNVLRHKYDDESMMLADFVSQKCPNISYDSHIIIASRDMAKRRFASDLPKMYDESEYMALGSFNNDLDIYVLYNGKQELFEYTLGYDEEAIKSLYEQGFKISLTHKVKDYKKTDYLAQIDKIVKDYDVEYLNLKLSSIEYNAEKANKENYMGLVNIIKNNDLTLVVTENTDQLSNQRFLGYDEVFKNIKSDNGDIKVLRSYESYDDSKSNPNALHKHRVDQFFHSTIDRNIRFITVTQLTSKDKTFEECADSTILAATEYKKKVEELGYTINQPVVAYNYTQNTTYISALAAVVIVMCALLIFNMVFEKNSFLISLAGLILAVGAFGITFILPSSLKDLYPTMFCAVMSCTAITAVLYFVKKVSKKVAMPVLLLGVLIIMMSILLIGGMIQASMLSGLDYYINNKIFRGIKVSLIIPVLYTTVIYYLMFIKQKNKTIVDDVKTVLVADIKVYWVLLAGVIGAVGIYYIVRSGNVSEISALEQAMRTTITEYFPARPRTKEFLIGYPALILFAYYSKNTDYKLVKWILAIAMSILAASITNSFCHVFTDFSTIVERTLNGLLFGSIITVLVYIANIIILKIFKFFVKKYSSQRR